MTDFGYTTTVPNANNPPSQDQPVMLENTASIAGLLAVDHTGFNSTNGGTHAQVTLLAPTSQSITISGSGIVYTQLGVAASSVPALYYLSSAGNFPINLIKAGGTYTMGTTDVSKCFNVASASTSGSVATITLTPGVTTGNNVTAIVTVSNNISESAISYTFSSGVLTVTASVSNAILNFIVIQI